MDLTGVLQSCRFTPLVDANDRPVDHCPISLEPMEDPVLVCDGAPAARRDWHRRFSVGWDCLKAKGDKGDFFEYQSLANQELCCGYVVPDGTWILAEKHTIGRNAARHTRPHL